MAISLYLAPLFVILNDWTVQLANAQALSGGGGGGGGGYSGGGDHDSGPTCASNCRRCTTSYTCDKCDVGYVITRDRKCAACSSNCIACDQSGAGWCDECQPRFTMRNYKCHPCAQHCSECDFNGPGSCDRCDDGYLLEDTGSMRHCLACTSHCKRCRDTSAAGCEECFMFYNLVNGGCSLNVPLVAALTSVIAIVIGYVTRRCMASGSVGGSSLSLLHGRVRALPSHREWVGAEVCTLQMPSGMWRGYYMQTGTRHNVCEFNLAFDGGESRLSGNGVDDIGTYTISGLCGQSRLAFTKQYEATSSNVNGVRHYGNKGHSVEYFGELAGHSLGEGFRGNWGIRHSIGNHDGTFHIWPAMEGFQDSGDSQMGADPGRSYEESECVVCYDRAISTRLRPCGHVALCSECAARLRPRKCPLCRTNVDAVDPYTPPRNG